MALWLISTMTVCYLLVGFCLSMAFLIEGRARMVDDDVFAAFDGASPDTVVTAYRNADGTLTVVGMEPFPGPDGEELFASVTARAQLDGWSRLLVDIWAAGMSLSAQFDQLEDYWGLWIAALPCKGPFDPMAWQNWRFMRAVMPPGGPFWCFEHFAEPNPWTIDTAPPRWSNEHRLAPPLFPLQQQQFPRVHGLDRGFGIRACDPMPGGDIRQWALPEFTWPHHIDSDPPPGREL